MRDTILHCPKTNCVCRTPASCGLHDLCQRAATERETELWARVSRLERLMMDLVHDVSGIMDAQRSLRQGNQMARQVAEGRGYELHPRIDEVRRATELLRAQRQERRDTARARKAAKDARQQEKNAGLTDFAPSEKADAHG